MKKVEFMNFNTRQYWEKRYKNNGNSGDGSYGILCDYKANIINDFIKNNNIYSVVEFGCGDGNQLSKFKCDSYIGYDVSDTVIKKCKEKFITDKSKQFFLLDEYDKKKYDLSLSLDVIYHLVEDDEFIDHLKKIFSASDNYVIIYSSNEKKIKNSASHIRERTFTYWIKKNIPEFLLIKKILNSHKYNEKNVNSNNSSISDFFIYKKI